MKAMVYTKYGLPDVLNLEEVREPTPKDIVRLKLVHAFDVPGDEDVGMPMVAGTTGRDLSRLHHGHGTSDEKGEANGR